MPAKIAAVLAPATAHGAPHSAEHQQGDRRVPVNPRPTILAESLRSIGYTLESALADIVDNSISASAKAVSLKFLWEGGNPWIAIVDDGDGMCEEKLVEAMRFGSQSPRIARDPHDMGRFGLGLKTASISQCRRFTVVSLHRGAFSASSWDLDDLGEGADWELIVHNPAMIAKLPLLGELSGLLRLAGSGTIVCWQRIDQPFAAKGAEESEVFFSAAMDRARKHLELVYHRFLSPEIGKRAIKMDFNGNPIEAFDPFGPTLPSRQELPQEQIDIGSHKVLVQAYVLPHHTKVPASVYDSYGGEEGYFQSQGFYVYRNRRLIIKSTWFRLIRKEALSKLVRVRVDIPNSLDEEWRIDVKKAEASPPPAVLRELGRIIRRISDTGRRVYTRRATTLTSGPLVPVWKREVRDGLYAYSVNESHPLVAAVLKEAVDAKAVRNILRLVSSGFPTEAYFSDAANDQIYLEIGEKEAEQIARDLVEALKAGGLEGDQLRQQLVKIECPALTPALIDKLVPTKNG